MLAVKSFTCVDCGAVGEQQARGRKRLRCQPCGKARQASLSGRRTWPSRKAQRSVAQCEACGNEYPKYRRGQRWCSIACGNRHKTGSGPRGGLSPAARERQRLYWQEKNRRRRAAKRGGVSEPYTLSEIAERDSFSCALCGDPVPMDVKVPEALAPTVDHVVAIVRGGDDTKANVQLAHFRCNSIKGPRDVQSISPVTQEVCNGAC